jgi:hypothetical protein
MVQVNYAQGYETRSQLSIPYPIGHSGCADDRPAFRIDQQFEKGLEAGLVLTRNLNKLSGEDVLPGFVQAL